MKIKTFLALLLLVIVGCGCSKADKDTSTEAVIVREIPQEQLLGINLEKDTLKVIQSRKELQDLFPNQNLGERTIFKEIDFSTQTVLLGSKFFVHTYGVKSYDFLKKGNNEYTLKVGLSDTFFTQPRVLYYGIIVKKISDNANISFNIQKNN